MLNFIREIREAIRFFKTPRKNREIIFFSENKNYYPYFEGMIACLDRPYSYITSDPNDPILKEDNAFYLQHLLPFLMLVIPTNVFVMTLTDLGNHILKRSVSTVHYVYVFHSMVSTHMMYTKFAFANYDSVLCTGPYQVKELKAAEEKYGLKPKVLIQAGYHRLERIHAARREPEAGTVLLAPSWGERNILAMCGEELIGILLDKGFRVIVRPHPEICKRTPELIAGYEEKFGTRIELERSVESDESLLRAEVLISDLSGVCLEYAFGLERPVLFLNVPPKVKNADFGELELEPFEIRVKGVIGKTIEVSQIRFIDEAIAELVSSRESYRERIVALREESVFNFGASSAACAKVICTYADRHVSLGP